MVSMDRKAPSTSKVKQLKSRTGIIRKYGPAVREITPLFDRLNKKDQLDIAVMKSLQELYRDLEKQDPTKDRLYKEKDYSDKIIKKEILSLLGVATKKSDDVDTVKKDSAGRATSVMEQRRKNPQGFRKGGSVSHRGRPASRSSEKNG